RLGGRGIYYQEVFGPDPAKCTASIAEMERALSRLSPLASSHLRLGVSPHAPYTVSEPLYRAVAAFARRERLPIAVHLAESREETALVRDGAGPFAMSWNLASWDVERCVFTAFRLTSRISQSSGTPGRRWPTAPARIARTDTAPPRSRPCAARACRWGSGPTPW
ncbi:MAG: hypothetical protein DMD36_13780, partial [Gemmatimonadetes bacterium]